MLDCLSNGRIISGFARGIPREHNVYSVPLRESRARFEEAWEIIRRAWTEEVFSFDGAVLVVQGRGDLAAAGPAAAPAGLGAGDRQQGDDRVGGHATTCRSRRAWCRTRGLREDIIRYYARCLAQHGHRLTPDHLIIQANVVRRRQQGPGGAGGRAVHALLQPDAVQPRQRHRAPRSSATPAI